MNRRSFLKSTAVATAALALPSWLITPTKRRTIDLRAFCGREGASTKFDMTAPFQQGDFTYATDSYAAVRVEPLSGDKLGTKLDLPPAAGLSWNHDRLRGWEEMPRLQPIVASNSRCPKCQGTGYTPDAIPNECETCGGTGHEWIGSNYDFSHPIRCRACKGKGHFPPVGIEVCAECKGKAIGNLPSLVNPHGRYFEFSLYEKVRALGGECLLDNWHSMPGHPLLRFRFAEGLGLLIGLDRGASERRIKEARAERWASE